MTRVCIKSGTTHSLLLQRRPIFHMTPPIAKFTKKLPILLSFYFHEVLQHLKTFIYTNFRFHIVLRFAIEDT